MKKIMICPFHNKNWREFQTFYICPHSAVHSGQWDLGITLQTHILFLPVFLPYMQTDTCIFKSCGMPLGL